MLYIITPYDWMNKKQKIKKKIVIAISRKNLKEIIMLIVVLKIVLTK